MNDTEKSTTQSFFEKLASPKRLLSTLTIAVGMALAASTLPALAQTAAAAKKPNIVIIWGADIGQTNVSAYSMGLMGFHTPNIDRVAKEGMIFTDYYAEQSCTAGRASFITGQSGLAYRLDQSRHAGRHGRVAEGGSDDCRAVEGTRLCHRPIRQKPSG